tara:strand:- start:66 stop:656 length:591 start_codon:yes stop_codon:yes gene_type:complete
MANRIGKYKVSKKESALSVLDGGNITGAITQTSGFGANRLPMYTKSEVITDDGDGTRTLLASETNTVFLIDDAALILILPTVSEDTVGVKYKFVIAEEETTGVTIKTQGNTHYMSGYAVITADAAVPQLHVPDGNSESEINLNGGTTGGKGAGITGDSGIINVIEATCISGNAGAAWFVEAHLFGDGSIATPFADQ